VVCSSSSSSSGGSGGSGSGSGSIRGLAVSVGFWLTATEAETSTIKRLQAWEAFHFLSVTYCTPVLCALLRAGFMYFEES